MKQTDLEQKLERNIFKLDQLQSKVEKKIGQLEGIEIRLWQLENPPRYKYGDTFGKIKVLESGVEKVHYCLLDSVYVYFYTIDNGSYVERNISEEDLTKMIEKN